MSTFHAGLNRAEYTVDGLVHVIWKASSPYPGKSRWNLGIKVSPSSGVTKDSHTDLPSEQTLMDARKRFLGF